MEIVLSGTRFANITYRRAILLNIFVGKIDYLNSLKYDVRYIYKVINATVELNELTNRVSGALGAYRYTSLETKYPGKYSVFV